MRRTTREKWSSLEISSPSFAERGMPDTGRHACPRSHVDVMDSSSRLQASPVSQANGAIKGQTLIIKHKCTISWTVHYSIH